MLGASEHVAYSMKLARPAGNSYSDRTDQSVQLIPLERLLSLRGTLTFINYASEYISIYALHVEILCSLYGFDLHQFKIMKLGFPYLRQKL